MSDLERELATVLTQGAGPSDTDPRAALAEHERRMVARARTVRNRAVAGVVAIVAVVGVSVAVVVNRPAEPSQRVATQPTSRTEQPDPGGQNMMVLVNVLVDGDPDLAALLVEEVDGEPCVLLYGSPIDESTSGDSPECVVLDTTPNEPLRYQRSVRLESDDPSLADLTVWMTTPEVAEISVVRAGGETIIAKSLGPLLDDRVFTVAMPMDDIQRVTMRDANGTVLREYD